MRIDDYHAKIGLESGFQRLGCSYKLLSLERHSVHTFLLSLFPDFREGAASQRKRRLSKCGNEVALDKRVQLDCVANIALQGLGLHAGGAEKRGGR